MGNRAIIKGKGSDFGVYVHWNGGIDSVTAFLEYCKLKGYRSPETDSYGDARLCQVIGNFFGGSLSVGIEKVERFMDPEYVESLCLDNGVYEVENWGILAHYNPHLIEESWENHEGYELQDMLLKIDGCMPKDEQLGKDFITAEIADTNTLKIGDKVYIKRYDEKHEIHTVVGIGDDGPYVDLYEHNGDYSWNQNNYIREKFVRKAPN